MRTPGPESPNKSPAPSSWTLPLYLANLPQHRIDALREEGRLPEALESESRRTCDDPFAPKFLVSIIDFIFRRNRIEALGIVGAVLGVVSYVASLLKPLWKWLGIILVPLGIIGGVAGYFMGAKLSPGSGAAASEPIRVPPGRFDDSEGETRVPHGTH